LIEADAELMWILVELREKGLLREPFLARFTSRLSLTASGDSESGGAAVPFEFKMELAEKTFENVPEIDETVSESADRMSAILGEKPDILGTESTDLTDNIFAAANRELTVSGLPKDDELPATFRSTVESKEVEASHGQNSRVQREIMSRSPETQSARSLPEMTDFESDTRLIVAIDFGTTFTGVAYVFQPDRPTLSASELKRINENIRTIKEWPNRRGATTEKTPTILAYKDGAPGNWGGRIERKDSPQFTHFKLGLQERVERMYTKSHFVPSGYLTNHDWRHPLLPDKRALDITTDYLNCVIRYLLTDQLSRRFGEAFLQNQQISYIITVPAVWSEKAKDLTRQAAVSAGIPRRKLNLITEPEAAAHYCSIWCKEMDLQPKDCFLVCDAGGGTVVRALLL
jgi:hypothetical protein